MNKITSVIQWICIKDISIEYKYNIPTYFHAYIKQCLPFVAIYSLSVFFFFSFMKNLNKEVIGVVLFIRRQGNA